MEEVNAEPAAQRSPPGAEETPARMAELQKALLGGHSSLARSLAESSAESPLGGIIWEGGKRPEARLDQSRGSGKRSATAAAAGGDGVSSDSSTATDEASPAEAVAALQSDSPKTAPAPPLKPTAGPAVADVEVVGRPAKRRVNVDIYITEEQIINRMKELRKRYSESLQHVRRLRRSLGSISPSADEGEGSWDDDPTQRSSRGSDDMDDEVFDEYASGRPRVKSLKRPEVVAQEKGIATASLFSTKPSTDEIKIDENGYKSYQCLLCSRTFTHPPAFSQHKRAHGREAASGRS